MIPLGVAAGIIIAVLVLAFALLVVVATARIGSAHKRTDAMLEQQPIARTLRRYGSMTVRGRVAPESAREVKTPCPR